MKKICFQKFSWLYILLFVLIIVITTISINKYLSPIKKSDFIEIKVNLNSKKLINGLKQKETIAFKASNFLNYKFIIVSKKTPFIKNLTSKNTNYTLYIEKKSYESDFKNYNKLFNKNRLITKSIYVYGIYQNKNKIINLIDVINDQNKYPENFLKISLIFWLFFIGYIYVDSKIFKK